MAESLAWEDHRELPTENRQAMANRTDAPRVGTISAQKPISRGCKARPYRTFAVAQGPHSASLEGVGFAAIIPPAGLPLPGLRRRLSDIPACLTGT
jgi:hypothetical protein